MKRKGIAGAIGFDVNHPLRTSPLTANAQGEDSMEVKKWRKDMRNLVFVLGLVLSFNAYAWENCGQMEDGTDSNCEWQVTSDGVLRIRPIDGEKEAIMPVYTYQYHPSFEQTTYVASTPWYTKRKEILSIQIEDGIEHISKYAFMDLRWANSVTMADSVISIGNDAFTKDMNLTDVRLSKNLKSLGGCVFQETDNLSHLDLPEGLNGVYGALFNMQYKMKSIALPDSLLDSGNLSSIFLYSSGITTIYCSKEKEKACSDLITASKNSGRVQDNLKYELYEKYGSSYIYNGKFYNSLGDIGSENYVRKRIYTIEEANAVAGDRNTVRIKYR